MKRSVTRNTKRHKEIRQEIGAMGFLAPFLIIFVIFFLWPVINGIYVSLHEWRILGKVEFVGLNNYIKVLSSPAFYKSLWHSIYFVLLSTPAMVITGLLLALLVNSRIAGRTFARSAYFLPYVLSVSVVSFIWLKLYDSRRGLLNVVLNALNLPTVNWLTDRNVVWWSIVLTSVWWGVGFVMVLYLSALQEIPQSYYEAAGIDGASKWQQFIYITLPSIKNITIVQIFFQVIGGLKLFGQTQIMTGGGPGDTTRTMIMYIYNTGFKKDLFGEAAAMSFLYSAFMMIFVFLQNRASDEKEA